ncbi:MAG: hypothetical protein IJX39_07075 [Clostridia bacterium]|nr:hypothetical protein [Clostridia bacterium]
MRLQQHTGQAQNRQTTERPKPSLSLLSIQEALLSPHLFHLSIISKRSQEEWGLHVLVKIGSKISNKLSLVYYLVRFERRHKRHPEGGNRAAREDLANGNKAVCVVCLH